VSFVSTYPTNLIKLATVPAVAPTYIYVSDAGVGREVVSSKEFSTTETVHGKGVVSEFSRSISDLGSGLGKHVSVEMPVTDTGLGSSLIAERSLQILDQGIPLEKGLVEAYSIVSDTGLGDDKLLSIELPVSELGLGTELVYERSLQTIELGYGSEARLSPIPISTSDLVSAKDIIGKRDIRVLMDTGLGSELSYFGLLVSDTGLGTELAHQDRMVADTGLGGEVRLSPITKATSDQGLGIDKSLFNLWEVLLQDTSYGEGIISKKESGTSDIGSSLDTCAVEKLVSDQGSSVEQIIEQDKGVIDTGLGSEVRVSPKPIITVELSLGYSKAWHSYREDFRRDDSVGEDFISILERILPDTSTGTSTSLVGIPTGDLGSGLEVIIVRDLTEQDLGSGIEVRLSPIPLTRVDTGFGSEYVISDKNTIISDKGLGSSISTLLMRIPWLGQGISSTTSTARHYGVYVISRTHKTSLQASSTIRGITIATATLKHSISINYLSSITGKTSFITLIKALVSSSTSFSILSDTYASSILKQSINALTSSATMSRQVSLIDIVEKIRIDKNLTTLANRVLTKQLYNILVYGFSRDLVSSTVLTTHLKERVMADKALGTRSGILYASLNEVLYLSLNRMLSGVKTGWSIISEEELVHGISLMLGPYKYKSARLEKEILSALLTISHETKNIPVVRELELKLGLVYGKLPETHLSATLHEIILYNYKLSLAVGVLFVELVNTLYEFVQRGIRLSTTVFKFLYELEKITTRFRYVSEGEPVKHQDHNVFVDFCNMFLNFASQLVNEIFPFDEEVKSKLQELGDVISKLERVYALQVVLPEHHNSVVDALLKIREFLVLIRRKVGLDT